MKTNLPLYILAGPLLAAFAVNILGRFRVRLVAPLVLGTLGLCCLGALNLLLQVLQQGSFYYVVGNWTAPYGIALMLDPLSALMLLLITGVAFLAGFSALTSADRELPGRQHLFFTLYLIMVAGLCGLVITADAFNLYVLLEITSISTYGMIAMGKGRAPLASFNYIILGSIGACFYLLGVGYLYILTGTLNMADIARMVPQISGTAAYATAFGFAIVGVWVKMAFFPLHNWLPRAYWHAPSGMTVMVAPLMTKVSVYLMVRLIYSVFQPDWVFLAHVGVRDVVLWIATIGILVASFVAYGQRDLKRMLVYLIVAEVGYMVGGVWLDNTTALTGALLHIVNDALMTLCLFLACSAMLYTVGSTGFDALRGLYRRMPWTMAAFTLTGLSMIGVPPTCGFFSKWYLLLGALEAGQYQFVVALIVSSLINAILFFRMFELAYFKAPEEDDHHGPGLPRQDAPLMMVFPLLVASLSLLAVGFAANTLVTKVIGAALPLLM